MTAGLDLVKTVCDYIEGNSNKSLDQITDKIVAKVQPSDLQDFFDKIALFSSSNSRYQELKANCEAVSQTQEGLSFIQSIFVQVKSF